MEWFLQHYMTYYVYKNYLDCLLNNLIKTSKKDNWTITEYPNKYVQCICQVDSFPADSVLKFPVIFKDTNYICLISNDYTTSFNFTSEIRRTVDSLNYISNWSGTCRTYIFLAGWIA